MQPQTNDFVWTTEETVIQAHGTGPGGTTYVNPADDPRRNNHISPDEVVDRCASDGESGSTPLFLVSRACLDEGSR